MGRPNGSGLRNPAPSYKAPGRVKLVSTLVPENLPEGIDAALGHTIKVGDLKTFKHVMFY
jgi:hypothetical protein